MEQFAYIPGKQCIYNVPAAPSEADKASFLNNLHDHCITNMKAAISTNDTVRFWTLACVDIRAIQANFKS